MMTDYERTLTVAIKAISELIEDNRKLREEIETLRESKPSTSSNQSDNCGYAYKIDCHVLAGLLENCSGDYSPIKAAYLRDNSDKFIKIYPLKGEVTEWANLITPTL